MMRLAYLILLFPPLTFDAYEWSIEYYENIQDKIHTETLLKYKETNDPCLPFSIDMKNRFKEHGLDGDIFITGRKFPMTTPSITKGYDSTRHVFMHHAFFVSDGLVYDNGALNPNIFPLSELLL